MKFIIAFFKNALLIMRNMFSWMKKDARHPERTPLKVRYKKLHVLLDEIGQRINLRLVVKGLDQLDNNETYFYTPNHQSVLDPLIHIMISENPTSFVAKYEAIKMPIVNTAIKDINGKFMKREDMRQTFKVIREVTKSLQEKECSWVVYPEGTRSKNENFEMNEFKHGTFKMAINSKATIVPVALSGTWRLLSTKAKYKNYPMQLSYLKPIPYEEYKDMTSAELAQYVEKLVREEHEKLRANEPELIRKFNPRAKVII